MHRMKALLTRRGLSVVGLVVLAGVAGWVLVDAWAARRREEADVMLARIEDGAHAYFAQTCRFPDSRGLSPAVTCCGRNVDKDGDGRCDSNRAAWDAATWRALGFVVTGEHRFTYAFHSSGTGTCAEFVALAYADLDCAGRVVTFQVAGRGQSACGPRPRIEFGEESEGEEGVGRRCGSCFGEESE